MTHLKGPRHVPYQGICDHPQRLYGVLVEPLDILPMLHFILIIEGEEGLSIGISCIPELEGRPTPARELLLCSHER
jgi:hypothetical protein